MHSGQWKVLWSAWWSQKEHPRRDEKVQRASGKQRYHDELGEGRFRPDDWACQESGGADAGEGEEEFQETIDTLKEIGFTKIHTFPYSRRNGTPASTMSNQVEESIKKKRVREVINLSNELENTYYNKFIGRVFDGLVETRRDEKFVLTSNDISVVVNDDAQNNEIVNVMITKVDNDKVYGKIVK